MNCVELQASLAEIEDGRSPAQRDHLKSCPECSALVSELILIASTAVELRGGEEPGPHLWKSIESALRQEGIIRPQRASRSLLPSHQQPLGLGALDGPCGRCSADHSRPVCSPAFAGASACPRRGSARTGCFRSGNCRPERRRLVAGSGRSSRPQIKRSMRTISAASTNTFRMQRAVVAANPNDDEARRSLMEAYQQKAMLFELAMDRSLP